MAFEFEDDQSIDQAQVAPVEDSGFSFEDETSTGFSFEDAPVQAQDGLATSTVKNIGVSTTNVVGDFLEFLSNVGTSAEEQFTETTGFNPVLSVTREEGDILPTLTFDPRAPKDRPDITAGLAERVGEAGEAVDYKPQFTWERFKGKMSAKNLAGYIVEQGGGSLPHMAAAMGALPAYILSRTQGIAEARVANDQRDDVTMQDLAASAPTAVAVALLEKVGAQRIFKGTQAKSFSDIAKAAGKAAAGEGLTEFGQETLEYFGETVNTKKDLSLAEGFDRGLAGAVAGGGIGGTLGTASAGVEAYTAPRDKPKATVSSITDAQSTEEAINAALANINQTLEQEPIVDIFGVEPVKAEGARLEQEPAIDIADIQGLPEADVQAIETISDADYFTTAEEANLAEEVRVEQEKLDATLPVAEVQPTDIQEVSDVDYVAPTEAAPVQELPLPDVSIVEEVEAKPVAPEEGAFEFEDEAAVEPVKAKVKEKPAVETESLLQWGRRQGRFNVDAAMSEGLVLSSRKGLKGAFSKKGRDLDEMAIKAHEDGYITEPDKNLLLDKLAEEVAGNPQFTEVGLEAKAEREFLDNRMSQELQMADESTKLTEEEFFAGSDFELPPSEVSADDQVIDVAMAVTIKNAEEAGVSPEFIDELAKNPENVADNYKFIEALHNETIKVKEDAERKAVQPGKSEADLTKVEAQEATIEAAHPILKEQEIAAEAKLTGPDDMADAAKGQEFEEVSEQEFNDAARGMPEGEFAIPKEARNLKKAADLADWVSTQAQSESMRSIATQIKSIIPDDVVVRHVPQGDATVGGRKNVMGKYHKTFKNGKIDHAIYITPEGSRESTVTHELIHAATVSVILRPQTFVQRRAVKKIEKFQKYIVDGIANGKFDNLTEKELKALSNKDAITKPAELVTYAMTKKSFQEALKKIPASTTAHNNAWSELADRIMKALGLKDVELSAFEEAIDLSSTIVLESKKQSIRDKKSTAFISGKSTPLNKITITQEFERENGDIIKSEVSADEIIEEIDGRIDSVKKLIKCLGS